MPIYIKNGSTSVVKYPYTQLVYSGNSRACLVLDCGHLSTGGNDYHIEPVDTSHLGYLVCDYRSYYGNDLPWCGSEGSGNSMNLIEHPGTYSYNVCVNDNQTSKAATGSLYDTYDSRLHRKNIYIPNSTSGATYNQISGFRMDSPLYYPTVGYVSATVHTKAIVRTVGDCDLYRFGHVLCDGNSCPDYTTRDSSQGVYDHCVNFWDDSVSGDTGIDAIRITDKSFKVFHQETISGALWKWWICAATFSVDFISKTGGSARAYRWLSNPIFQVHGSANWWAFYVDSYAVAIYGSGW